MLKIINVNLDYYKNVCYDKVNQLDKFYKLLTIDNKDDLDKVIKKEKILKNYSSKLIDLSSDEKYVEGIMDEIIEENVAKQTAYLLGEQSGLEKGISQGIQENKREVVLNMYKNNLSTQMIANCTNLSISEIEEIINNNKE
ncbi:MAG: hypothetical protein IJ501_03765 [Bacilli bacterium]|nr:hypothetical protein [Bacilli bacterium]